MGWACERAAGGGLGSQGEGGESWGMTAGGKALEKVEWVCGGEYELVGSGGACDAGLVDVQRSHCPSNPILDGKIQALNENDDDGDDDDGDDD